MGSPARSPSGDLRESAFQGQVIDLARYTGWRVAHFRPARTERGWRTAVAADGAGFVDLVLVRGPELLFVELKTRTGKASSEQREWLDALRRVDEAVEDVVRFARDLAAAAGDVGELGDAIVPLVEVYLWRPGDWDEIEVRLKRRPRSLREPALTLPRR